LANKKSSCNGINKLKTTVQNSVVSEEGENPEGTPTPTPEEGAGEEATPTPEENNADTPDDQTNVENNN